MVIQETTKQLVQHTSQAITDKQPKDVLSKLVKARTQINVIQINVIWKRDFQIILCNFFCKPTSFIELTR